MYSSYPNIASIDCWIKQSYEIQITLGNSGLKSGWLLRQLRFLKSIQKSQSNSLWNFSSIWYSRHFTRWKGQPKRMERVLYCFYYSFWKLWYRAQRWCLIWRRNKKVVGRYRSTFSITRNFNWPWMLAREKNTYMKSWRRFIQKPK